MEYTRLGRTGLSVSRTSFGALPIQRIPESESTAILRAAYEAGINFYDTANAYTDSEFKLGQALGDVRRNIIIATKTAPAAPDVMQQHLEQSLKMLRTDYIDIYQLHCAPRVYRPGEEDGVYDWLLQKKKEGAIRHISVTAHRIGVAEEALESGLYDTLQYPFSVIADERELRLAQRAKELDIGFIAMKAMAGGLIQHPEVTFAFLRQYPQVVPIYGIQRRSELNQWLSLENDPPQWNEEMQRLAAEEKAALGGDFCRSCGYCMPCPMGIEIPNAARMSLLMTRAPYQPYITKEWQAKMHKIESCINCRRCVAHCPYSLDTPRLLDRYYRLKSDPRIVFAGQMTGVEGYVESCASGFLAGVELARRLNGQTPVDFPAETAIGALGLYVSNGSVGDFQPMNINFGIIPPLDHRVKGKRNKNAELSRRSLDILSQTIEQEVLYT